MQKQYKYFVTFDKTTMVFFRIGIVSAIFTMLVCAGAVAFFSVANWRNSYQETQARIRLQDALIENIGKPQIVEQRYFSPMEEKK
ncbi:MAG: hypothetical protein A2V69_01095 [Candidatus Portnoybacteria bacterium RBG_13_40_8]|uniref:Uncharacterized protein n=1 Tax=Candidatus Portnoybacteria bacterium RBG_13_40_8 TaxID=1801990 RepID=A0A1G2F2K9_9BACT|nr:MAG: hypothetical protein A2V69_01095 [Candidatus Portnoybacteria bacterium RBG_13_40_8]